MPVINRANSLTMRPGSLQLCSQSQCATRWAQMAWSPGYKSTTSSLVRAAGSRSKTAWMSSLTRLITPMARTSSRVVCASSLGMRRRTVLASPARSRARTVRFARRLGAARLRIILVQLVFDRVNQRLPARFDHVARQSNGAPSALAVSRFYQHAHARLGARAIVEDTDFVIDQLHRFEIRIVRQQRVTQGRIKRVDRTVADRGIARAHSIGPFDDHNRLAERRAILVPFVVEHAEADEVEMFFRKAERAQHQQLERSVRAVEGVARAFEPLEFVEQLANLVVARRTDVEAELLGLVDDIRAARELREQHAAIVAEQRGIDMFVSRRVALNSRDVQSALMRERAAANIRLARERRDVGELVHQRRDLAHRLELRGRHAMVPELELQIRDDRNQVCVAASLAEAVYGALHLHGARAHSRESVGDRDFRVVVAMNSNRAIHRRARRRNRRFDFMRQASAVGVAQRDQRHSGVIDRLETGERVFGIVKIAVEEMLGVENRFVEILFQKSDRVVDDFEIFVERNSERLAHVHVPGLADHGRDRCSSAQQQLQIAIGGSAHARAARRTERRNLRVPNLDLLDLFEKRRIAIVRARPSALNIIEAQIVQPLRNRDLVLDRQRDVLGLAAVAQSSVVNLYVFRIRHLPQTRGDSFAPPLPLPVINASCNARIASSPYLELTTTETLISEVEIISILIRSAASTLNMVDATPEWVRMPTPTTETLATCSLCRMPAAPISLAVRLTISRARFKSSRPIVNVMSVRPSALAFWIIISTTIPASAMGLKIFAASPGRSSTPATVILL